MSKNRKIKTNWKTILCAILAGVLLIACIGGISSCFKEETTKEISSSAFERGGLDENGEYVETKKSLYTVDAFACRGLKIVADFEADCTFDVYYYDNNENLVEAKFGLKKVYDEDYPLYIATKCRVVIHPNAAETDEKYEIGIFDIRAIASQLTITVNKDQSYRYENSSNLYDKAGEVFGKTISNSSGQINTETLFEAYEWDSSIGGYSSTVCTHVKSSNKIAITGEYDKYDVYVLVKEPVHSYLNIAICDVNGNLVDGAKCYEALTIGSSNYIGHWVMKTLEVPANDAVDHLRLSCPANCEVYVFGYN